jgi:hypothetical protein
VLLLQEDEDNESEESDAEDPTPTGVTGADIANLGRFTDRSTVLEHGLLHLVRRVQRTDGFRSYAEYEAAFNDLIRHVQASVAYQQSLNTKQAAKNSIELMTLCCELSAKLASSEICKHMCRTKQTWEPQRRYILQQNSWEIGTNSISAKAFKVQAKLLTTCYQLYAGTEGDDSAPSDDPFGKGNVFGQPDGNGGGRKGKETRKCHNCGKTGHIGRHCPDKAGEGGSSKDGSHIKCFRCLETGHTAKDCDGERKS